MQFRLNRADNDFPIVGEFIFSFICRICNLLPCPECQKHAKNYLQKQKINLKSKTDVREFMHKFHNAVNKYKKVEEPSIEILDQYKYVNLAKAYNNFASVYTSSGNIRLFADNMQRSMLLRDFRTWLLTNKEYFTQEN